MANVIKMYISVCKMYSYIIQADRSEGQCYTVTEQLGVGGGGSGGGGAVFYKQKLQLLGGNTVIHTDA